MPTTIARYCFAERTKEVFAEALARGFLTAIRDWPRLSATVDDAIVACAQLRAEVCCINDEMAYRSLTESAWLSAYHSYHQALERDAVKLAFLLREMPFEEALGRIIRPSFLCEGWGHVERGYAEYLAQMASCARCQDHLIVGS